MYPKICTKRLPCAVICSKDTTKRHGLDSVCLHSPKICVLHLPKVYPVEATKMSRPKNVIYSLCVLIRSDTVPQSHELSFHALRCLKLRILSLPQKRVHFIDKYYRRLEGPCECEHSPDELLRLPKPLVLHRGETDVDENCLGFFRDGLGELSQRARDRASGKRDAILASNSGNSSGLAEPVVSQTCAGQAALHLVSF